jgi:hypothetical protein
MRNSYMRDISLQTGIEHQRGLQQAAAGQVPSFVSKALIASTIEDSTVAGQVASYVLRGHECFIVRIPNPYGFSWFANRFYVVSGDAQSGYFCSATAENVKAGAIRVVEQFIAASAA